MALTRWAGAGLVGVVLCVAPARADTGYEGLADWNSLPRLRAGTTGMASSYNRGGNTLGDFGQYDGDSTDGYYLVRELTGGPGVVTRFWMPQASADGPASIRLTVDGNVFTTTSKALFDGTFGTSPAFSSPLASTLIGGRVSYEPITFQSSIKIESTHAPGNQANFYQWEYRRLLAGTAVPSFNGTIQASQQADRAKAANVLAHPGQIPAEAATGQAETGVTAVPLGLTSIPGKSSVTLANVTGSGQVRSLALKLRDAAIGTTPGDATLDQLRVRVRYDGAADYAIDVPVSSFFGVGHGRADYKSVPVGVADDGTYYSHWPMPYRQGLKVELYNDATTTATVKSAAVEYKAGAVAADAGYLNARSAAATLGPNDPKYTMLHITGKGQYVGNLLSVDGVGGTLEGNDIISVNGADVVHGTGLEDAYNGGYYYNDGAPPSAANPLYGLLRYGSAGSTDQYRWRITDAVPFDGTLDVSMENFRFSNAGSGGVTWGSTAFYYLSVPEPSSAAVGLIGAGLTLLRRRRAALDKRHGRLAHA